MGRLQLLPDTSIRTTNETLGGLFRFFYFYHPMEKLLLLSLFFILLGLPAYSQVTVPKHYELKGQAYTQADSIHDIWMDTQYWNILKKNKLKMKCSGCDNIYMDVVMGIDNNGRLLGINVVKTKCCTSEFSENLKSEFLAYFGDLIFPPSLWNMTFEYRLGTGLSC